MADQEVRVNEAELQAYCDGALPPRDEARVMEALADDPALRAEMARMMREKQALAAAAPEETPDPAIEALAARLSASLDRRERRMRLGRTAASAAAVLVVAAGGWIGHDLAHGPERPAQPAFLADAVGAHSVFGSDRVHPVEFGPSDQALMRSWFSDRLGDDVAIPQLEEIGFALVGGRLLGDAEGPMAQLIYENPRGDRVSLVFGKRSSVQGAEPKIVHVGKTYAGYWRDGGFAWAVVEDSPGADVPAVAAHVARMTRTSLP